MSPILEVAAGELQQFTFLFLLCFWHCQNKCAELNEQLMSSHFFPGVSALGFSKLIGSKFKCQQIPQVLENAVTKTTKLDAASFGRLDTKRDLETVAQLEAIYSHVQDRQVEFA